MATLRSNFFQFPLVDTHTGFIDDEVGPTEIINYIFKKSFGFPNSRPYTVYYDEAKTTQSFPNIFLTNQYSQYVPSAPPTDLIRDTTFIPYIPTVPGLDTGSEQQRWYSAKYRYLAFYSTINTSMLYTADNPASYSFYTESNGSILTQNAIPIFYGMTYSNFNNNTVYFNNMRVYERMGNQELYFGTAGNGSWLFDTDSGIVTFYDTPPYGVGPTNTIKVTFWRYEGLMGNSGIANITEY